jgi:hypothetical protein
VEITIQGCVSGSHATAFLRLYQAAFSPLAELGAQRQQLHDDEFLACLEDPRVLKLVGWDDAARPVAMAVMAPDLALLPWFSPAFFRAHLPEHTERTRVYGIVAILVHPSAQGGPWYRALAEAVALKAWADAAVVVFDCCRYNVEVFPLPATLLQIGRGLFDQVELVELDTQHYFALDASGLRRSLEERIELGGGAVGLDRRWLGPADDTVIELTDEAVVDLRDATATAGEPAKDVDGATP